MMGAQEENKLIIIAGVYSLVWPVLIDGKRLTCMLDSRVECDEVVVNEIVN